MSRFTGPAGDLTFSLIMWTRVNVPGGDVNTRHQNADVFNFDLSSDTMLAVQAADEGFKASVRARTSNYAPSVQSG